MPRLSDANKRWLEKQGRAVREQVPVADMARWAAGTGKRMLCR